MVRRFEVIIDCDEGYDELSIWKHLAQGIFVPEHPLYKQFMKSQVRLQVYELKEKSPDPWPPAWVGW